MPPRTQREVIDSISEQARRALRKQENQDVAVLIRAYRRAQDDIQQIVMGEHSAGEWSFQAVRGTYRGQRMMKAIGQKLAQLNHDAVKTVHTATTTQYQSSYQYGAYMVDHATPPSVPITFETIPVDAVAAVVSTPYEGAMFSQRIGTVTDAMSADIRDELAQSLINGESMDDATYRVRNVIGANDTNNTASYTNRAENIARTEIMRAQALARDYIYDQNRDILEKEDEWIATPDDRLCEWCMSRDGKTKSEFKPIKGDPNGKKFTRPLHPRCRCDAIPRVKSWKDLLGYDMPESYGPDTRGIRDSLTGKWSIAPVKTFDQWKAQKAGAL